MTNSKSLRIEKVPASTLLCIKWNGGGEVPAVLSGTYTSYYAANQAIKAWLAEQGDREVEVDEPQLDEQAVMQAKKRGRPISSV